jgi:hypothetical protein
VNTIPWSARSGIHRLKPFQGHLTRSGTHVGQYDRRTLGEAIDEHVESSLGVDVDLPGESVEVVLEAAARLVLGIEIEKREWDFIGEKPFRQMNHESSLATPPFPP